MRIFIILILLGLLFISFMAMVTMGGEQKNLCHDEKANQKWEALMEKYPDDNQLFDLYCLREGLCIKIEQGAITTGEAHILFENARRLLIEKRQAVRKLEV